MLLYRRPRGVRTIGGEREKEEEEEEEEEEEKEQGEGEEGWWKRGKRSRRAGRPNYLIEQYINYLIEWRRTRCTRRRPHHLP
eukprot:SAG11_NODE_1543_length_4716_cov_6.357375_8_plen_82_part_00